jgi:hypothetical protein
MCLHIGDKQMSRVNQYVTFAAAGSGTFKFSLSAAQTVSIGGVNAAEAEGNLAEFSKSGSASEDFQLTLLDGALTVKNLTTDQAVTVSDITETSWSTAIKIRINTIVDTYTLVCQDAGCSPTTPPATKKSSLIILWVILGILGVGAVGVGTMFFLKARKSTNKSNL